MFGQIAVATIGVPAANAVGAAPTHATLDRDIPTTLENALTLDHGGVTVPNDQLAVVDDVLTTNVVDGPSSVDALSSPTVASFVDTEQPISDASARDDVPPSLGAAPTLDAEPQLAYSALAPDGTPKVILESPFGPPTDALTGVTPTQRHTIAPEDRGGAPRGQAPRGRSRVQSAMERPQLRCVRHGDRFRIGFDPGPAIVVGGVALKDDRGLLLLSDVRAPATWERPDGVSESIDRPLPLVFQLAAAGDGGPRVPRLSPGLNLVITPSTYEFSPSPGVTRVSRPGVGLAACRGWEIDVDEDASVAHFISSDGSELALPVGRVCVSIDGEECATSSRGVPIFGMHPPVISVAAEIQSRLDCLIIGKEQPGPREQRRIEPDSDINAEVTAYVRRRGGGWYYLRAYTADDDGVPALESSTSFWFLPGLRSIEDDARQSMPSAHGRHEAIRFTVQHTDALRCIAAHSTSRDGTREELAIEATDGESIFDLDGLVICDAVEVLLVAANGAEVIVRRPVVRYWWAVTGSRPNVAQEDWSAQPIDLSPAAFMATSDRRLRVREPVDVGRNLQLKFRDGRPRSISNRQDGIASYRLGEFDDEVRSLKGARHEIWLIAPDGIGDEDSAVALRMVPAFACRRCDAGTERVAAMREHIQQTHLSDLQPRITDYKRIAEAYNRIHGGEDRLPQAIHRCMLCDEFYPSHEWRAINSQSVGHLSTCKKLVDSGHSSAPFEIVTNIDRIRASAAANLVRRAGDAYDCTLCKLVTFGAQAATEHVFSTHSKDLYDAS
jgi:hypothetical protein